MGGRSTLQGAFAVAVVLAGAGSACSGGGLPSGGDPGADVDGGRPKGPVSLVDGAAPGPVSADGCVSSPESFDVPGNGCDDDGDGLVDNAPTCDDGSLPVDGAAADLLRSMGICQQATAAQWGVVSAELVASWGSSRAPADGQQGILLAFGSVVVPREGKSLAVLSSGYARAFDDAAGSSAPFKGTKGLGMQAGSNDTAPPGYPKTSPGCPLLGSLVFDLVDLRATIKVPANAQGFSFDFDFWSGEWPEYVCTHYNDTFVAFLGSKAFHGGTADNISFDANGNTVSVNNGFFDRCTAGTRTGCAGSVTATATCPGGPGELRGTGFLDPGIYCGGMTSTGGGATGWLTSTAPLQPGEVMTIDFIIWDTGDVNWDSSVLLDHFQWSAVPLGVGTARPM